MPVFELEESDYAGPIEDDSVFETEVVSVRLNTAPFKDKNTGADIVQVEFKFLIEEEGSPWDGQNVYGRTSTKFNTHSECKLRNWSQAILATELPTGYQLDTDLLIGNKCRVVVGARDYVDKEGNDKTSNYVKDVMPSRSIGEVAEAPF